MHAVTDEIERTSVAHRVLRRFGEHGVTHATGVPCSYLAGLFSLLEHGPDAAAGITYLPVAREDIAVGLASGLSVGGRQSVVLMQNSGLGYCLNVLTSFNLVYELALPIVVSWRGQPGTVDAPEHEIIGDRLPQLLATFDIDHAVLDGAAPERSVDDVMRAVRERRRVSALLVTSGTVNQ